MSQVKARIVFMGTPDFGVPTLESLVRSHHDVVAAYTRPDRPAGRGRHPSPSAVKRAALAAGVPVVEPLSLRDGASVRQLTELQPDLVVVAAFSYLLPPSILQVPRYGCLNVHPSLLPRYRGPSPVAAALLGGDSETGVSIMLMDEGLDSGPVLNRRRVSIGDEDTTGSLTRRLAQIGAELVLDTVDGWIGGDLTPERQREEDATYSRRITALDGRLDWSLPAAALWRQVRAYHPWPGCHSAWKGLRLKVLSAVPVPVGAGERPGTVVVPSHLGAPSVGVQTADGVLVLRRVQLEGKKEVAVEEFVRGHRDFVGSVLEQPPGDSAGEEKAR